MDAKPVTQIELTPQPINSSAAGRGKPLEQCLKQQFTNLQIYSGTTKVSAPIGSVYYQNFQTFVSAKFSLNTAGKVPVEYRLKCG